MIKPTNPTEQEIIDSIDEFGDEFPEVYDTELEDDWGIDEDVYNSLKECD